MTRTSELYLNDIIESIGRIKVWVNNVKEENFYDDLKLQNAVTFELVKIGEAVKNIPFEIRNNYPNIPWKSIAGMRDNLVHEYFGINEILIWETVETRLDELEFVVNEILLKLN